MLLLVHIFVVLYWFCLVDAFVVAPQGKCRGCSHGRKPTLGSSPPAVETSSELADEPQFSFQTKSTPIYIEDTDAYGIMYNSNYLRAADRALHASDVPGDSSLLHLSDDWNIISVQLQLFKASPVLGCSYVVEGRQQEASNKVEIWDLSISDGNATTYNILQGVSLARKLTNHADEQWLPQRKAFASLNGSTSVVHFSTYRDEFDGHLPGRLPLRSVLNLFERSRTDWLGGPDGLRRLQEEDQRIFVVVSVSELDLIDGPVECRPGDTVSIKTHFTCKKRGLRIDCEHTALCHGQRIAQGRVGLLTLDAKTRRPTSKLPTWLQSQLGIIS